MTLWLGSGTDSARLAVVFDELLESRPGVLVPDLVEGLCLTEMP